MNVKDLYLYNLIFVPLPNWFEWMNEGDRTFAQQDTNMAEMKDMWTLSNPDVNIYHTPASLCTNFAHED
jgi:hypothetical protein